MKKTIVPKFCSSLTIQLRSSNCSSILMHRLSTQSCVSLSFELCNWISKTQSIPFFRKLKRPFHCISFRPVKLNRQPVRPQIRHCSLRKSRELDIFIPPTTGFINPQFGDLDISFYFTFCEFWDFPPTLEWQNNDPDFP